jgi:hypothetical protein
VSDSARLLLTAAVLSAVALGVTAWRVARIDASDPARLIGELRVAQWAAVLLAATAGLPMGLSIAGEGLPAAHLDVAFAFAYVLIAGLILQQEPRTALLYAIGAFASHALVDIAHRPGLLSPDLAPRWAVIGSAVYDVVLAATCYWARRR